MGKKEKLNINNDAFLTEATSLDEMWNEYKARVVPEDATEAFEAQVKSVFYSGAASMHMLTYSLSNTAHSMRPREVHEAYNSLVEELEDHIGIKREDKPSTVLLA